MKAFNKLMSTIFEAIGVIIKLFLLVVIVAVGFAIYNVGKTFDEVAKDRRPVIEQPANPFAN